MVKKKKETNEGFLHKVGKFLVAAWGYIVVGRDYFWKAVRFTLATGIFLYIAISVVISLISPLWQESNEIDPTGKVVVFSPQGVVVDQPPTPPPAQWWEDLDGVIPSQNGTIYYPYQDMLEYFEDFKNDERVDAMIFDPSGLGVSIVYALPIAKKMKEAVDAGKEIVVRSDFLTDGTYLLASTATEISVPTYSGISINGFGGARQYLKNFFEKFLITPRIFAAGDFKTGPEPYTSDRMSDEAKANLAFYDPLWKKWKDFVYENREIDLQWLADESYKQIIDGSVDPSFWLIFRTVSTTILCCDCRPVRNKTFKLSELDLCTLIALANEAAVFPIPVGAEASKVPSHNKASIPSDIMSD